MTSATALLTFSIGPVHTFIAQARRVADLWAGSDLLSHLISTAIERLRATPDCELLFPWVARADDIPDGLPNRFVARVPATTATPLAEELRRVVLAEWDRLVAAAVSELRQHGINPSARIWTPHGSGRQTDAVLDVAWSWVPEDSGYAEASRVGAQRFRASRLFRPFVQVGETAEKCAVCGERTALPDGDRKRVRGAWEQAGERGDPFFRADQGRLCLVCATKRLYPRVQGHRREAAFLSFQDFEPQPESNEEQQRPYFAVVTMDGDRMGQLLRWDRERIRANGADGGDGVAAFHREVSRTLSGFADGLRDRARSAGLNVATLARPGEVTTSGVLAKGRPPQLIYAGGEDVLFLCDPRHALPLARAVRDAYRRAFEPLQERLTRPQDHARFTISAAVLLAHTKQPAGLVFEDARQLLKRKAKGEAGRDALAVRLAKRGGVPEEVAFKWDARADDGSDLHEPLTLLDALQDLTELLRQGLLASRQTFSLRAEEGTLLDVLRTRDDWHTWLQDRLRRGGAPEEQVARTAGLIAPFFLERHTAALRLARFLGTELPS